MSEISYRHLPVDGHEIFYREAGRRDAPSILLLHGFPSAGRAETIPISESAQLITAFRPRVMA